MFLAVTLFHVGTTYTCKLFSLLQFTLQWHNLLLLGLVNSIFKYKPDTRLLFRRKTNLVPIFFLAGGVNTLAGVLFYFNCLPEIYAMLRTPNFTYHNVEEFVISCFFFLYFRLKFCKNIKKTTALRIEVF